MNKNEIVITEITDFTREGEGIGRAGGYTLFVKDAVIGDTVRARITRPKKNYAYARVEEILVPSPDRIPMRCPEGRRCGGCRLEAYRYEKQLDFKQKLVADALTRIGGFRTAMVPSDGAEVHAGGAEAGPGRADDILPVLPVRGMAEPYRYRNKAQYPVAYVKDGDGLRVEAGFYAGRTHSLIPVRDCKLTHEVNADILQVFLTYMKTYGVSAYDEETGSGLVRHLLIREGFVSGEILVCPVINGDALPHAEKLVETLREVPGVTSICLNHNTKRGNAILGEKTSPLFGNPFITDSLAGHTFRISPRSFYQVNPAQTEVLYGEALRAARLTGQETVCDLYCGIGTIALTMAPHAREVFGVEIVPDAVRDAKENAARNSIANAHFYEGAAEKLFSDGYLAPGVPCPKADVVVLDPPRKGCDPALIEAVRHMAPERVVYVSCDPATLARDLRLFAENGAGAAYRPVYVQPVDMFPQTVHVETVCLLSKLSGAKHHVSITLDMEEMDLTAAESKATYQEIQEWVQEKYGFHVSHLNIAKTKRKCGIIERKNYNLPKSEDSWSPETPKEKEEAIREAFKYFQMID